jgi:threonylcarbamoyladenosine tRNA methylthiotransferase MtaB
VRNNLCHISSVLSIPERPFRLLTDTFLTHSRSSIKIQDGCNNACTYCCIHLARGHSVSLDVQSVLDRVRELERSGQKEVVFTAVNIAQYRGEWHGSFIPFAELLKVLLDGTEGIFFRMSSLYPEIVDEKLCRIISDQRVRPHFHLSVQSGSDSVLHAMQRPYTVLQVRKAVQLLRNVKENPFIACDIIAGFPGETSDDFEQTMQLCRDSSFSWIHAFPFSPRPGTPAYTMRPSVPQSETGKRVARLTELACDNKIAYINSFAGKIRSAVAETVHHAPVTPQHESLVHAVTDNFLHCELRIASGEQPRPGSLINVTIEKAFDQRIRSGSEWEASASLA